MSQVAGAVVDPRIKRASEAKVNLHQMPGSHSVEQLNGTIKASMNTERVGNQGKAVITVAHTTAGHYVPTSSPLWQLVLEVRADTYNGRHLQEERVYRRAVADAQGAELKRENHAFLKGAKTLSDTRLAPDEKRVETFTFDIPAGAQAQLKATFWYYYSPLASTESQKRVTFLTLSRLTY
jgi:hypothetical protein